MDKTAIQAGSPPQGPDTAIQAGAPANGSAEHAAKDKALASRRPPKPPALRVLEALADLRLTVWLFALSLLLVFYGTWAQVDQGVWAVVNDYFRSIIVWMPLKLVVLRSADLPGSIPFPGGWLLGTLLLVNLLAAHIIRFKVSWRRSGILLIHAGIVVMMLGELVTGLYAREGMMTIVQGQSTNYVEHHDTPELAFVDSSDPQEDRVTVIPTALLKRGGLIQHPDLPFDVEVHKYMVNSDITDAKPGMDNPATKGLGLRLIAKERPEGAGVDANQAVDLASAYVTLKNKDTGEAIGTYLFSNYFTLWQTQDKFTKPQTAEADGKEYQVGLRFQRSYKEYAFHLEKLNVSYYPRSDKPKDYSSFIRLTDPTRDEDRQVRIYMNNPLRYEGETFYQSKVDSTNRGVPLTVLQVVRNPGWLMPYLSCAMVSIGMLVHFGLNLTRFVQRRAA